MTEHDQETLGVLRRIGLDAAPDSEMDSFAAWAREAVAAPSAWVALAHADRVVLPGAAGEDAAGRSLAAAHPLCRHVVASAAPVVVADTRADPLGWAPDLGSVSYAGFPLHDRAGRVLGALAVTDRAPRRWSPREVDMLGRIARACSTSLQLRLADRVAAHEEHRRDAFEAGQQRAFDRSQILLGASQAFTDTETVGDVRARISELLAASLAPDHVDVVVVDDRDQLRQLGETEPAGSTRTALGAGSPGARAIAGNRILHHPDRSAIDQAYPGAAGAQLRERELHTVVVAPLPASTGAAGAVILGWRRPHAIDPADLLTIATLAGYAAQALGRARHLSSRTSVAHDLQVAMLTTLPRIDALPMAARYAPADSRETVGGDWYDAVVLDDPDRPGERAVLISVGDVIGHSLRAATIMGQARSMLRQSASDHHDLPPSRILEAFEAADSRFDIGANGTTILARIQRLARGGWSMTWTNAGHPPPILLHPDGTDELLGEHDILFGFDLTRPGDRHDHRREIARGSLLFLYTDGLVERRDSDLDAGTDRLRKALHELRDREPQEIVDALVDTPVAEMPDDVVAFAVRFT
ncbi:GAF domain-containing SpoIIE family protein phosphatase [Pseudonocardia nematodicida]|uniref:GAF domain-containing SpoIIE family protein phosphatase n=1 Tax=Pseudonocardia nematodicida TaxID=1206997 RepID=A0ABV1KIF4_9PSEU